LLNMKRMKTILFPLFFSLLLSVSCSLKSERIPPSDEEIVSNGRYFASDNDEIQYSGRIDFSSQGKAVFSLPAVKIQFRFTGSEISVHMKDLTAGGIQADGNPARNYFNVYIDEQKPFVLGLVPNDTIYLLASGLRGDEHTAVLVKRTEALAGKVEFCGIWLEEGKELLPLPERSGRKIEFIGNSITCGYGVEAASENDHFGCATENVGLSYASLTAEALHAEYNIVAYSGRGVAQNYSCSSENTMPVIWKQVFPDEVEPVWDHHLFIPDVTVINLGTNDFNCGVIDTSLFRKEYAKLIRTVRQNYPDTKIVCLVGSMLNDNYPANSLSTIRYLIQTIMEQESEEGDSQIYYYELSPQTGNLGYGADWHPSVAQQKKNALELTTYLSSIMGWIL